jgi:hypothetical protein
LASLTRLDEQILLEQLHARYDRDQIYTYVQPSAVLASLHCQAWPTARRLPKPHALCSLPCPDTLAISWWL